MKITVPDYFEKFKCAAQACQDTCCKAEWQIIIDKKTAKRYKSASGDIGKKLCRCLTKDSDGDFIFKSENNICPFLNNNGLCEIHSELGEEMLCKTCRIFPRFIYNFGGLTEKGLCASCPEAVRIMLSSDAPITFKTEVTDCAPCPNDIDPDLFHCIYDARNAAISILQFRKYPIERRAFWLLKFSKALQKQIKDESYSKAEKITRIFCEEEYLINLSQTEKIGDFKEIKSILLSLEILSDKWRTFIESDNSPKAIPSELDFAFEHILVYFVFKYFLSACYDGKLSEKVKLAIFSFIAIKELFKRSFDPASIDTLTEIIKQYSREIEHSDNNLKKLYKLFSKKGYIKLSSFLQ